MRRITQLVALMVALLLAGQSAMAEVPCSTWLRTGDHSALCCTSAPVASSHQTVGDCHGAATGVSITADCSQGGCQMATVRPATQVLITEKSKTDRAAALVVLVQFPTALAPSRPARSFESASAARPAKYLLFQVFRI